MPAIAEAALRMAAPAKINLALHVTGRRQDGYHELDTLAAFATVGDFVTVSSAPRDSLRIAGRFADGLSAGADNLVARARDALRARFPDAPAVAIELEKNLPVASGMGGGSSDAAATLHVLAEHWRLGIGAAELARLGGALGADVPMCLEARPLRAVGIGHDIALLDAWPELDAVLVNPGTPLSTAAVFSRLQRRDGEPLPSLPRAPGATALIEWLGRVRNDLEAPARQVAPAIDEVLDALRAAGAGLARMSGSGATCFGLFESADAADDAATTIARAEPGWFVAATKLMGSK